MKSVVVANAVLWRWRNSAFLGLIPHALATAGFAYPRERFLLSVGARGSPPGRRRFRQAIANGSIVSWQHINLLGEYDFSDDKLEDSVGIKPPKLAA